MVSPVLGSFSMNWILEWDEDKTTECAKKKVTGKSTPTVETGAYITTPRYINITCRVTSAEKITLYTLEHTTQTLKDENGVTIDTVWIESVNFKYTGFHTSNGVSVPYLARIVCMCTTK